MAVPWAPPAPSSAGAEVLHRPDPPPASLWRRLRRSRSAVAGVILVTVLTVVAVLAPVLATHDPTALDTAASLRPPGAEHWFGTDLLGRDVFARVVYGARPSLRVGLGATVIAVGAGLAVGAVAGWYGGWLDAVLMRTVDVLLTFPYLLVALVVTSVVGSGEGTIVVVLGLVGWMHFARVVRSVVVQAKQADYVEAARCLGGGGAHVLVRHVLPGAVQPVVALASVFVGTAVVSEAALSFLGLGIAEPTPAWGSMVADGRRFMFTSPHLLFFPGLAIFVMVMAWILVGDGLRDVLRPRGVEPVGERG